jgi:hypothetical protein
MVRGGGPAEACFKSASGLVRPVLKGWYCPYLTERRAFGDRSAGAIRAPRPPIHILIVALGHNRRRPARCRHTQTPPTQQNPGLKPDAGTSFPLLAVIVRRNTRLGIRLRPVTTGGDRESRGPDLLRTPGLVHFNSRARKNLGAKAAKSGYVNGSCLALLAFRPRGHVRSQ